MSPDVRRAIKLIKDWPPHIRHKSEVFEPSEGEYVVVERYDDGGPTDEEYHEAETLTNKWLEDRRQALKLPSLNAPVPPQQGKESAPPVAPRIPQTPPQTAHMAQEEPPLEEEGELPSIEGEGLTDEAAEPGGV